jgi:hypothetical protein
MPHKGSILATFDVSTSNRFFGGTAWRKAIRTASMIRTGKLLVRIGAGRIAAGIAVFATTFSSYMWLTLDTDPASAELRAQARALWGADTIDARPLDARPVDAAAVAAGAGDNHPGQAKLRAGAAAYNQPEFNQPDHQSEPQPAGSSFGDRFALGQTGRAFDDRFFGEVPAASAPVRSAAATPPAVVSRNATAVPAPRPVPRSPTVQNASQNAPPVASQATSKRSPASGFQLASASDTSVVLAYAPNPSLKDSGSILKDLKPKETSPLGDIDTSHTAIYDITSRTVYLPNARRLEAHSGLGKYMDDPRYVSVKDTGPTPPNVYELKMREAPFHGVRAIRLIPTDNAKMHGRDGILAHSYLLGPSGQSNGCVSFRDYDAFLDAFLRGEINRIVVVESLTDAPSPETAASWLVNTLKDVFRRS